MENLNHEEVNREYYQDINYKPMLFYVVFNNAYYDVKVADEIA